MPHSVQVRPSQNCPRPPAGKYRTLYDQRARTTVLVNVAGILERCNEQTLPALYKVRCWCTWERGSRPGTSAPWALVQCASLHAQCPCCFGQAFRNQ